MRILFAEDEKSLNKIITKQLKAAGYSTNKIRTDKLMGQATLQQLRHGELASWKTIDTVCRLLDCQPGDLLEHVPTEDTAGKETA